MRILYLFFGTVSVVLGLIGIVVPRLPTVPFMLLAAFCFARSNPAWERKSGEHPRFGPPIRAWRERGAIARPGKIASMLVLTASAATGLWLLETPWRFVPLAVAVTTGAWIVTRPD